VRVTQPFGERSAGEHRDPESAQRPQLRWGHESAPCRRFDRAPERRRAV